METSVADCPASPEVFGKTDWDKLLRLTSRERVTRLWEARNPLSGSPIEAIWAFDRAAGRLRFFDVPRGRETAGDDLATCRAVMARFANWLPTVATLRNHRPRISDICDLVRASHGDDELLKHAADNFATAWVQFENMTLLAVYDQQLFRQNPINERPFVDAAIAKFYDYYSFRRGFWSALPLDFVARTYDDLPSAYLHLFCDPKLFHPGRKTPPDMFLWPWQRCLTIGAEGKTSYTPLRTTSLVLDLRNSTTAMNLFTSPEQYADFISEVVQCARAVVVEHGGFFDKELGDGIVGHFCDLLPDQSAIAKPPTRRAYMASRELGRRVGDICQKFQQHLELGIGGLSPSIGIHVANAVWIVVDDEVRAIGPSVVTAARLCASARSSEAVISNSAFVELASILGISELSDIQRKPVSVKEYGESAALFAHGYVI